MQKATFAAGCFWGVEELFRRLPGVHSTLVGYTGGHKTNPTYQEVCSHQTGHAEAVQIEFDPEKISYQELLTVFFANHNPTTLNQQGLDTGSQYRSAIFYHSPAQKAAAEDKIKELEHTKQFKNKIVTEIVAADIFYPAEDYHQNYLHKCKLQSKL